MLMSLSEQTRSLQQLMQAPAAPPQHHGNANDPTGPPYGQGGMGWAFGWLACCTSDYVHK